VGARVAWLTPMGNEQPTLNRVKRIPRCFCVGLYAALAGTNEWE